MNLSRRKLITGLVSFVAAPAVLKASSLMPVKSFVDRRFALEDLQKAMMAAQEAMYQNLYNENRVMERMVAAMGKDGIVTVQISSGGGSGRQMDVWAIGGGGSGGRWDYTEIIKPFKVSNEG